MRSARAVIVSHQCECRDYHLYFSELVVSKKRPLNLDGVRQTKVETGRNGETVRGGCRELDTLLSPFGKM